MRLPLRSRVWKGQAGEFLGAGVGSSLDFQDHRTYVPGDDPRHINWQAYARTGHYTMKLYREEVRPVVDLVLDASDSMFFEPVKAARSAELFYFLAESRRRRRLARRPPVRGDATTRSIPPNASAATAGSTTARALPAADPAAPPTSTAIPLRANAIRVLVSDLLFAGDPEPPPPPPRPAPRQRRILLAPFLAAEARPDWPATTSSSTPNATPATRTASSPPSSALPGGLRQPLRPLEDTPPAATRPPSPASLPSPTSNRPLPRSRPRRRPRNGVRSRAKCHGPNSAS